MNLNLTVKSSESISMKVIDCSATGISATVPNSDFDPIWTNSGDIVTQSKLTADNTEIPLGRLVMRRIDRGENETRFAFSTIDSKVPVNGSLSKYLSIPIAADQIRDDRELSPDKFNLAHFAESENTNNDLFDRIREFSYFHREWVNSKKYAYQNIRTPSKGPRVNLKRQRKNGRNDYLVMGSNDYLGLGAHPEVINAAKAAMDKFGFGATGSPVTTGITELHIELCDKLARIHQKEAALLFNSGYAANVGIISGVTSSNDLIVADQLCHASIQDGMQMSKATSRFFKHNNVDHLRQVLEKERGNYNGCLIITEGIFSMDGDVAALDKIYAVAREFNCRIMVDQAHDFGVLGPNGIGVCDKYHLLRDVDIIMGTFSKIGGSIGGFVTGSKELIDWMRSFSRAFIFSVSLPPSTVAATSKALDIFINDKSLLENLRANIKHFIRGLEELGYPANPQHESSIIPVVIGDEKIMGEMYQSLMDDGIFCSPIVYPAVSKTNCRFRFTIAANQTTSDIDYALSCLEKAMLKVGFQFGKKEAPSKAS